MPLRRCCLPLALVLVTQSGAVHAADRDGNYAVWGIGAKSCNMYNQAAEAGETGEFRHYVMGYLTAYDTFVPDTYRLGAGLDLPGVIALVADYCGRVPMDSFERALRLTAEKLAPDRQKQAPRRPLDIR